MKPGTYVMSPKFVKDEERKQGLTRTVYVESIDVEQDGDKFAIVEELTTVEDLWEAGEKSYRRLKKWKFVPVLPA